MTATISLHPGPSAGFDAPFEMLEACHQRVHRMLGLLDRLASHLAQHGADDSARRAARDVMRYFDIAGPAHHEDEERHILPRLHALGHAELAERLRAEHVAMASAWAAVRADLHHVAEGQTPAEVPALQQRWGDYAQLYADHVRAEEQIAYPVVRSALAPADEQAIGHEMASRRGLPTA
jgi:hemerythrin-like domain-containing protein